jgi:hypothetical protein
MTRRILIVPAVLLAAGIALSGCSAASTTSGGSPDMAVAPEPATHALDGEISVAGGQVASLGSGSGGAKSDGSTTTVADRSVIQTGSATLTVDEPLDAADEATTIVAGVGGHVDSRSDRAATEKKTSSSTITLRIPSAKFDDTLAELEALGEVQTVKVTANDVTADVTDLEARIESSETSVDRLLALLSKATSTKDLISIEKALSDRQADLESMQAQKRYLDDQVSMSTLTLKLVAVADAPVKEPDTFVTGLGTGWQSFVSAIGHGLVLAGILLPWLVFFAIIAAIIVIIVRVRRRRARVGSPKTVVGALRVSPAASRSRRGQRRRVPRSCGRAPTAPIRRAPPR